jgi:hypothetical protein
MGKARSNPTRLEGEAITDIQALLSSGTEVDNVRTAQSYSFISMQLGVYFCNSTLALQAAKTNESFRDSEWPAFYSPVYPFFRTLIWIAAARSSPRVYMRKAQRGVKKLEKCTKRGMVNVHQMYMIAKAEFMTLEQNVRTDLVKVAFDDAVRLCNRSGFIQNAALANELCGQFMMDGKRDVDWGLHYLERAGSLYSDWKADAKLDQLVREFNLSRAAIGKRHSNALKGRDRLSDNQHSGKHRDCDLWSLASAGASSSSEVSIF